MTSSTEAVAGDLPELDLATLVGPAGQQQTAQAAHDLSKANYTFSPGLVERLGRLGASLAFTSYQSGLLYLLGRTPKGGAHLHQTAIAKPMGLCVQSSADGRSSIVLCGATSIIRFENILRPDQQINHVFDACFMPRTIHSTGNLDGHDIGIDGDGRIVFVNTRYNCLAALSDRHSFTAVWKPPFISALIEEDRCHLNGLAFRDGKPAFATAVSRSDTIDGWRDRRGNGGVVIDVGSDRIVCEGLSMPHSPRFHEGRLWVLNSGTGELGFVGGWEDACAGKAMGQFKPIAFCPGFVRGLALVGNVAFVGLSRPRYKRFEGLQLDEKLREADSEAWCGIQVIDLDTGACLDWFRIDGEIGELYDLALIPGFQCPMVVSPGSPDAAALITFD
jgi:uncharacterized protein (TIGR03032 family)